MPMPKTSAMAIVTAMLMRSPLLTFGCSPSGMGGASGSAIAISAERFRPRMPMSSASASTSTPRTRGMRRRAPLVMGFSGSGPVQMPPSGRRTAMRTFRCPRMSTPSIRA